MRKKITSIFIIVLPLLTLIFFYITARRGVFLFKDSFQNDVEGLVREHKYAVLKSIREIQLRLRTMAASGDIRHTLTQFDMSESLQKGQLFIKRIADRLPFCNRLRLVNFQNKIVIDSKEPGLEGKPLLPGEMARYGSVTAEKKRTSFTPSGEMIILIPTRELAGNVTGGIYATFHRDFFRRFYKKMGDPALNYKYYYSNDVLFFNLSRNIGSKKKISSIAAYLRKTIAPYYENDIVIIPDRQSGFPYVFAYCGDRAQAGLPALALWILLFNMVLLIAVVLWFVLSRKAEKQRQQLDGFREEIDSVGEQINRTTATADQIILQTETLYQLTEKGSRDLAAAAASVPRIETAQPVPVEAPVEEKLPSVDDILSEKAAAPDGGFIEKVKDDELQQLIDNVSKESNQEESAMGIQTSPGIFGAKDLEQYWENMEPLLKKSLGVSIFILHESDGEGQFTVSRSEGVSPEIESTFTMSHQEPLFRLFPGKRKVLFVKDRVLENKTVCDKLGMHSGDGIAQMAMIPIVKQEQICGLLTICTEPGGQELDVYSLHEVMYLSML